MEYGSLVSVIIPVYNVKPYLAEALESVLSQTYPNLEIIVVDDGSTDGSGEICDRYAEKNSRITLIRQENKGLSGARNVGLDQMHGEAVAFLDSDDVYHPDFIRAMTETMIRENSDIVLCKCTQHETTGPIQPNGREKAEPLTKQTSYSRAEALRALADRSINMPVWNKLYRRELWDKVRFPEGHVYEDVDTLYRVFNLCETLCVLDRALYRHRIHSGSITRIPSRKNLQDHYLAHSHFAAFIEANIPEIFTEEQLVKTNQSFFNQKMVLYIRTFGTRQDKEIVSSKILREEIIEIERKMKIESFSMRTRAAYRMLCSCPALLRMFYLVYRPFRALERAVTGR
ncbi:MAG: glycosyltransferase [Clostridia bacterium]|nr:glycosyltransferase [Clostridia bacterium]